MIRVAVVCDYPEEGWPSMDLTAAMIQSHLNPAAVTAERVCPPFRHRFDRLPIVGRRGAARNADRLLNRFVDYPRFLKQVVGRNLFDLYHLADHSYSQLLHVLPAGRSIVTCHDIDTFRCILEPENDLRPKWFRAMAGRTLAGFRKAAAVACVSAATRDDLIRHHVLPADRLHVIPNGVAPGLSPDVDTAADAEAVRLLGPVSTEIPELLHVGSTIARKRIDFLLDVFASVRLVVTGARLVRVGGPLTAEQASQAEMQGTADAIEALSHLSTPVLAAVYRRAAVVLQPSASEGFGLPVIEALACGAPVVASDLPVLREVAGDAAIYRDVGDLPGWTEAVFSILAERQTSPAALESRRLAGLARARLFSWSTHTDRLVALYHELLSRTSSD